MTRTSSRNARTSALFAWVFSEADLRAEEIVVGVREDQVSVLEHANRVRVPRARRKVRHHLPEAGKSVGHGEVDRSLKTLVASFTDKFTVGADSRGLVAASDGRDAISRSEESELAYEPIRPAHWLGGSYVS